MKCALHHALGSVLGAHARRGAVPSGAGHARMCGLACCMPMQALQALLLCTKVPYNSITIVESINRIVACVASFRMFVF